MSTFYDKRSLEDVRYYLRAWRRWCLAWRPFFGIRSCLDDLECPPAWDSDEDQQAEATERDSEISDYILHRVDQCVERLPKRKRLSVRCVYLREHCDIPVKEARRLCDEAEADLVPMLRARNVLVGISGY
jgi:hypothetical protein